MYFTYLTNVTSIFYLAGSVLLMSRFTRDQLFYDFFIYIVVVERIIVDRLSPC